jgi:hypothetical protein
MTRPKSTRALAHASPVLPVPPLTPSDLKPSDKVAVWPSWKLGIVESVTGWRDDHVQVGCLEPIRQRNAPPQPQGYPCAAHCARIGGAS